MKNYSGKNAEFYIIYWKVTCLIIKHILLEAV